MGIFFITPRDGAGLGSRGRVGVLCFPGGFSLKKNIFFLNVSEQKVILNLKIICNLKRSVCGVKTRTALPCRQRQRYWMKKRRPERVAVIPWLPSWRKASRIPATNPSDIPQGLRRRERSPQGERHKDAGAAAPLPHGFLVNDYSISSLTFLF